MTELWTPDADRAFRAAAGDNNGLLNIGDLTSWWPVDLAAIVAGVEAGEIAGPVPKLMRRTDGVCLLYPGEIQSLAGEPETGKGWIALAAAREVLSSNGHVLYIDCEDTAASIVARLLALGIPGSRILSHFVYVRPDDPLAAGTLDALLTSRTFTLAIVDGLSEAYTLLGLDPYSNVDAAKFLAQLPRPIAAAGAAVLLIDHVVKSREGRGRYALGAQHKLAGIAAAYTTDAITTPSRGNTGLIKLKVEKDRHGHVRPHATASQIALVRITPHDEGGHVSVLLEPPEIGTTLDGEIRPIHLMGEISAYVRGNPGASRNTILEAIRGRKQWKARALDLLVQEGYIDRQPAGQRHAHDELKPFINEPGPTGSQPGPGLTSGTGSHRVPPLRDPDPDQTHLKPTTTPR